MIVITGAIGLQGVLPGSYGKTVGTLFALSLLPLPPLVILTLRRFKTGRQTAGGSPSPATRSGTGASISRTHTE